MKTENYIKCYETLRAELGNLCFLDCEIMDMEKGKIKVTKATLKKKKLKFSKAKEHFRGMCNMANLTGEFLTLDGRSHIDNEFGWIIN